MSPEQTYPEFVRSLPQADIPMQGPQAYLLTGGPCQVVFFELPAGSSVPPHSHGAQWGIIVEGELEFTIGGERRVCRRGDTYYIPAGVEHSVEVSTLCRAIDFFAQPDRYQPKE